MCHWRMSVLAGGPVLILDPLVQAVASGLTNVLATKQAMYHALFLGKCPPLMLRTSPPSKRHGPVFHWLHQCLVPENTLGNAHHCSLFSHLDIHVSPAPSTPGPLTLKPSELLLSCASKNMGNGKGVSTFLCFLSTPYTVPLALVALAGHWT